MALSANVFADGLTATETSAYIELLDITGSALKVSKPEIPDRALVILEDVAAVINEKIADGGGL